MSNVGTSSPMIGGLPTGPDADRLSPAEAAHLRGELVSCGVCRDDGPKMSFAIRVRWADRNAEAIWAYARRHHARDLGRVDCIVCQDCFAAAVRENLRDPYR